MAIDYAILASGSSSTDGTSFTTASFSTTPSRAMLLWVVGSAATAGTVPTVTGNGLIWTQVATLSYSTIALRRCMLSLFRAATTSGATDTLTFDFGATTHDACLWYVVQFSDVDLTTNQGVVQSVSQAKDSGTSFNPSLAAFGSTNNATVMAVGANVAVLPEAGWSDLSEVSTSTPTRVLHVAFRSDNDTAPVATMSTSNLGGIAVELDFLETTTGRMPVVSDTESALVLGGFVVR